MNFTPAQCYAVTEDQDLIFFIAVKKTLNKIILRIIINMSDLH